MTVIAEHTKPTLQALAALGQAVWLDYIRRSFITSGELQAEINAGLRGITANPTILEKAIAGSSDYDEEINRLAAEGKGVNEIYEALAFEDIGRAADLFRSVYEATQGGDGFVSLEVSPLLANDTEGTIREVRHLFSALKRPNVMIKVPATPAGMPAIAALLGEGININITLIFSLEQYLAVAEAYLRGLEKFAAAGGDLSKVASVASFFVSRVDTKVDHALEEIGTPEALALQGKIAIANAKVAYEHFRRIFSGPRWQALAEQGARVQRPLWASTGTKNPHYSDVLYVDNLIGPDTVNTLPQATLNAFRDHGTLKVIVSEGVELAKAELQKLAELGGALDEITRQLLAEGVESFAKSFEALRAGIADKRASLLAGRQEPQGDLGPYRMAIEAALAELKSERVMARIWAHDYTVWKADPTEITNRLGWLHSHEVMAEALSKINKFVESVRADGYRQALLLGMGGSSLAPEVFRRIFDVTEGYLDLAVLDTTDPGAIAAQAEKLDLAHALFIVSTKSGGTIETLSLFKFFYNRLANTVGRQHAGQHFVAITDPGSSLAKLAETNSFRTIFLNDPNIGGRYSALSYYGLVPAALIGVELPELLNRASTTACNSETFTDPTRGDACAWLGTVMGKLAQVGLDKLTLFTSPAIASFGVWVEQLIAESLGKEGKGILPIVGEAPAAPDKYGSDRLFVYLRLEGDSSYDAVVQELVGAGQLVAQLNLRDPYDLGGEFFRWELATAVAGHHLGVNPFDQPNVEAAKRKAKEMVEAFKREGKLPQPKPTFVRDGIAVYARQPANDLAESLNGFLAQAKSGDYISLQAYLQPITDNDLALEKLRLKLRDRAKLAVTVGYGPRFLHSTGQLHKGDAGNGLFMQLTADDAQDLPIPDEAGEEASTLTFGTLKAAQALGDRQALLEAGRRVIRFHLGREIASGLGRLTEAVG